jgi:hypothetical protein
MLRVRRGGPRATGARVRGVFRSAVARAYSSYVPVIRVQNRSIIQHIAYAGISGATTHENVEVGAAPD